MYTNEKLKQIRIIEKVDLYKGDAEKLKTFLETNDPAVSVARHVNVAQLVSQVLMDVMGKTGEVVIPDIIAEHVMKILPGELDKVASLINVVHGNDVAKGHVAKSWPFQGFFFSQEAPLPQAFEIINI